MSKAKLAKVWILTWPWHDGVNPRVYNTEEAGLRAACSVIKEYHFIGESHEKHKSVLQMIEDGDLSNALELWNEIQEDLAMNCEAGYCGDESEGAFIELVEHKVQS